MRTLRLGSNDEMVIYLQRFLAEIGYKQIKETGLFDEELDSVVREFQTKSNITVDGLVGRNTMTSILRIIKGLTERDIIVMSEVLNVEVPSIKAIYTVESGGFGFLENGKPKILFEGHVFWKLLDKKGLNPAELAKYNPDIIYKSWTREHYLQGVDEWTRLERARVIDNEAAIMSASFGTFQIMGVNYKLCGHNSVEAFYENQFKKEINHLSDLGNFVKNRGLLVHLQNRDWAKFAYGYNGPAYKQNKYDQKLAEAYEKFSI